MGEGKVKKSTKKMRDEARKVNSTHHKRKRKKNYTLHYILIFVLIVVTGFTLSVTVFFNTQKIIVEGVQNQTPQQIVEYTQVELGDNLFRINLGEISDGILKQTVDLDDVIIDRKLPDTLLIKLVPSQAQAAVYNGQQYFIVSTGGRIIEQVENLSDYPELFVISGIALSNSFLGDFITENEQYQSIQKILQGMEEREISPVSALEIDSNNEIKVCYENRVTIYLGNMLNLNYKLDCIKQVIDERIHKEEGILDVRTEGVIRFQPMTMVNQIAKGKAVNQTALPVDTQQPLDKNDLPSEITSE